MDNSLQVCTHEYTLVRTTHDGRDVFRCKLCGIRRVSLPKADIVKQRSVHV